MQRIMLLAVLVAACSADPVSDSSGAADTDAPADCGDGVISLHEECDDGDANSDSEPNACRSTCRAARCGDGVQDRSEECDDGDLWGGDGCGPTCQIERGLLETEPNDIPFLAQTLDDTVVIGSLPPGDVDCYFVPGDGEVHATVLPDDDHGCAAQAVLRIRGEAGNEVLSAGPDETGCASITPERHEEARSLPRGPHAVCIEGLLGAKVTQYRLEVLSSKVERSLQACLDGEDNDEDGAVDCDDSDCASYIPCAACDAADLGSETGRALIADVELDTNRAAGSCGGLRGPEAVTSWTAPSTGRFVATSVAWERKVVLYATSGDCRGEEIACDARDRNSALTLDLDAGEQITVFIDSAGGDEATGVAILPATTTCPDVVLDDPEAPVALPLGYEFTQNDTLYAGGCTPVFDAAWHSFTAPVEGEYAVSTGGSDFDTVLYILASCGGAEIGCNDDGDDQQAALNVELTAGQQVVIGVGSFGGTIESGNASLSITPPE